MKAFLLLLVLLAGGMVVGCTPTESCEERFQRIGRVWEMDLREANEDFDRIWFTDKNQRDNEWGPKVGY